MKIGAISALFVALIGAGAALTSATLQGSRGDTRNINLAGRQRTLILKMNQEALAILRGEPVKAALEQSIAQFDQTLTALREGDAKLGIAAERDGGDTRPARAGGPGLAALPGPAASPSPARGPAGARRCGRCVAREPELLDKLELTRQAFEASRLDGSARQVSLAAVQSMRSQKLTREVLSLALVGSTAQVAQDPEKTLELFDRAAGHAEGRRPRRRDPSPCATRWWPRRSRPCSRSGSGCAPRSAP